MQTLLSTSYLAVTLHLSSTYLLSQQCPAQLPVPGSTCNTTLILVFQFHRTHQQSQVTISYFIWSQVPPCQCMWVGQMYVLRSTYLCTHGWVSFKILETEYVERANCSSASPIFELLKWHFILIVHCMPPYTESMSWLDLFLQKIETFSLLRKLHTWISWRMFKSSMWRHCGGRQAGLVDMKTKSRSRFIVEDVLICSLSFIEPQICMLCNNKQSQPSH